MSISVFTPTRRDFVVLAAALCATIALVGAAYADDSPDITDSDAFLRQQAGRMIIIDVRTPDEWRTTGVARDALTIDMQNPDFVNKIVELRRANPDMEIGFMCRTSHRSSQVQKALSQAGFDKVYSIVGGMSGNDQAAGWIADGLPTEGCC